MLFCFAGNPAGSAFYRRKCVQASALVPLSGKKTQVSSYEDRETYEKIAGENGKYLGECARSEQLVAENEKTTPEPEENAVTEETIVPEETAMPEKTAIPEETIIPEETATPEETLAPEKQLRQRKHLYPRRYLLLK